MSAFSQCFADTLVVKLNKQTTHALRLKDSKITANNADFSFRVRFRRTHPQRTLDRRAIFKCKSLLYLSFCEDRQIIFQVAAGEIDAFIGLHRKYNETYSPVICRNKQAVHGWNACSKMRKVGPFLYRMRQHSKPI